MERGERHARTPRSPTAEARPPDQRRARHSGNDIVGGELVSAPRGLTPEASAFGPRVFSMARRTATVMPALTSPEVAAVI